MYLVCNINKAYTEFPYELSRDITEKLSLWELLPSNFPEVLLAHASPNDWPIVMKHANMTSSRGCINAEPAKIKNIFLHFAEPRLWLKLIQLTVEVHSFEGRPDGRSSAAFR